MQHLLFDDGEALRVSWVIFFLLVWFFGFFYCFFFFKRRGVENTSKRSEVVKITKIQIVT